MEINKDLIAASSTPIVLAILAEEDSYGYAILQRVRELSGERMEWTDGMLYPVLHRLERREAKRHSAAFPKGCGRVRCTLVPAGFCWRPEQLRKRYKSRAWRLASSRRLLGKLKRSCHDPPSRDRRLATRRQRRNRVLVSDTGFCDGRALHRTLT